MASLEEVFGENFNKSVDYTHHPNCPKHMIGRFGLCSCSKQERQNLSNSVNSINTTQIFNKSVNYNHYPNYI